MTITSPSFLIILAMSVAAQILGMFLLPMTKGFTHPLWTIATAACFLVGIGLMARMAHSGMNLSIVVPIIAALVPMGAVAVGIFAYDESASLAKFAALVVACVLIGAANFL